MRIFNTNFTIHFILIIFLILIVCYFPISNDDFNKAYFFAGESILRTGTFIYLYQRFTNMPIVALLIVPFAIFGLYVGGFLFLWFEIFTYFMAFVIFLRFFANSNKDKWFLLFLFLFSKQIFTSFDLGQLTPLAFFLLVLMTIAYLKNKQILAGVLFCLAFLLKIPIGLFFLYFLYKKHYKIVFSFMITYLLTLILSVARFGIPLHLDYIKYVFLMNMGGTLLAYNNQNIFAFVVRFLRKPDLYSWGMVAIYPVLYFILILGVVFFVFYLLKKMSYNRVNNLQSNKLELSIMVCACLIVLPVTWDHYYLFLLLPFYVMYENIKKNFGWNHFILYIVSFILVNLPTTHSLLDTISSLSARYPFLIVIISSPFIGCVVLLYLLNTTYMNCLKVKKQVQPARHHGI